MAGNWEHDDVAFSSVELASIYTDAIHGVCTCWGDEPHDAPAIVQNQIPMVQRVYSIWEMQPQLTTIDDDIDTMNRSNAPVWIKRNFDAAMSYLKSSPELLPFYRRQD